MKTLPALLICLLACAPAIADIALPERDTDHIEYFASLAYAGPRLRDCSPKLSEDPRTFDGHGYGLFLGRWTGARPIYHGTPIGNFAPETLRLPAFFGAERFYPEIHAMAHESFPETITDAGYAKQPPPQFDPKLFVFDLAGSGQNTDFIYGYEFWPEAFAAALLKQPQQTVDQQIWKAEKAKKSGVGQFAKSPPDNIVSSRWMAQRLSELMHFEVRGVIARRVFPSFTVRLLTKAKILRRDNSQGDIDSVSSANVDQYIGSHPEYPQLGRYYVADAADSIRMGYDEVIILKWGDDPLPDASTEDLPKDHAAFLGTLDRWRAARCDAQIAAETSYSLDYQAFLPFPKGNSDPAASARADVVKAMLSIAAAAPADKRAQSIPEALRKRSNRLLVSTPMRLQELNVAYDKERVQDLLSDIGALQGKSAAQNLTAAEISDLRAHAAEMLAILCQAYPVQGAGIPVAPCRGGDLDLVR